jgi:hypothetical protein
MAALDFEEIKTPAAGPGRDQFELFAREFLSYLGYRIVSGPDRGPDGGRDLIVEEVRTGIAGETRVRWLVSCKHRAHAGKAVSPTDEPDIHDRVNAHSCQGFIGLYSTIPSSGLVAKLRDSPFERQFYDNELIEKRLLSAVTGIALAKRFFPESLARWQNENPTPALLFDEEPHLLCANCGNDLLKPEPHGIIVIWHRYVRPDEEEEGERNVEELYWCCKGDCDRHLKNMRKRDDLLDGWEDVSDLVMPVVFIRWVIVTLNQLQAGRVYSLQAFEKEKELLLNVFPLVSRHLTSAEKDRIRMLQTIPSYIGGLG